MQRPSDGRNAGGSAACADHHLRGAHGAEPTFAAGAIRYGYDQKRLRERRCLPHAIAARDGERTRVGFVKHGHGRCGQTVVGLYLTQPFFWIGGLRRVVGHLGRDQGQTSNRKPSNQLSSGRKRCARLQDRTTTRQHRSRARRRCHDGRPRPQHHAYNRQRPTHQRPVQTIVCGRAVLPKRQRPPPDAGSGISNAAAPPSRDCDTP